MKKIIIIIVFVFSVIGMKAQVFQEWTARYNGVDSLNDYGMSIDAHNCIVVTGFTQTGGFSNYDIVTIRYSPEGVRLWSKIYDRAGKNDYATKVVTDAACNIYVAGTSTDINNNIDFTVIKYDSAGNQLWIDIYNGPANSYDEATSIVVDNSGNVYATGYSYGISTSADYFTVKYNTNGVRQWTARYNGTGNGIDMPVGVALDNNSNVYVTGYSHSSQTNVDYVTIKYNNNGVQKWVANYNDTLNGLDRATAIAIDDKNNIYVTGTSAGVGTGFDYATVRYNTNGVQQWVARYNDPDNGDDNPVSLAVDGKGNIDVFGTYSSSNTGSGYATIQYSKNGIVKWVQLYTDPATSTIATAMALDTTGNVYVTGSSYGTGLDYDFATIKYQQKGDLAWVMRYNGTANGYDYPAAIAIDIKGNAYVTGYSQGTGTGFDLVTVKYNDMSNPNNPFDFVGEYHNKALDYIINHLDTANKVLFNLGIDKYIAEFMNNNNIIIKGEVLKAEKKINGIVGQTGQPMTNLCYTYLSHLSYLIDSLKINNIKSYMDSVKLLETEVITDNNLNKQEKEAILGSTSVARYSANYWTDQYNNNGNSHWPIFTMRMSFWHVVGIIAGDAMGFVVGSALLGGPGMGIIAGAAISGAVAAAPMGP